LKGEKHSRLGSERRKGVGGGGKRNEEKRKPNEEEREITTSVNSETEREKRFDR